MSSLVSSFQFIDEVCTVNMSFRKKALNLAMIASIIGIAVWRIWFQNPPGIVSQAKEEYDYIIVGSGTAGSVLAARLSEHSSVVLLESGNQFGYLSSLPMAAPFLQMTENDWKHQTVPQRNSSFGLIDQVSFWPRGKGLGGTGRMNYLVHYPGKRKDFDQWEEAGANGWGYETMVHYMYKIRGKRHRREEFKTEKVEMWQQVCETRHVFLQSNVCSVDSSMYHLMSSMSKKVYVDDEKIKVVKEEKETNNLLHALIESTKELRHLKLVVRSGEATIHKGARWDAYRGYLEPALKRKQNKIEVLLQAHVDRVIMDGSEAVGVQFEGADGGMTSVRAKKEVILCAGAVQSPAILMRSGIGPKKHLTQLGIKVVADLPVGNNLHDHLNVPIYVSLEKEVSITLSKVLRLDQLLKYVFAKKGYFATSAVAGTLSGPQDVGVILFGMGSTEERLLRVIANYQLDVFREIFPHHKNHSQEGFVFLVSCLNPSSRGVVRLRSTKLWDPPLVDPRYLSQEGDIDCTRKSIKLVKRLTMTDAFKALGARMHLPELPGCPHHVNINDNEYISCMIRTIGFTGYHPGGTMAMGNHTRAPLDKHLRVKKVRRLRVVDASVFPTPLGGTPNSVLQAVTERASSIILQTPPILNFI